MKQDIVYVNKEYESDLTDGGDYGVSELRTLEHGSQVWGVHSPVKPLKNVHVFTEDELKEHDKEIIEWYQKGLDYSAHYKNKQ